MRPPAWTLDAEALALVPALLLAYLLGLRARPAPRWRRASFLLGLALLLVAFATPLETLALHHLLTAHLLQNVVLVEWSPALLVLGLPPGLAARLGRAPVVRTLTHPLVALPLWLAVYFAWHVPAAYDAALRRPSSLLHVEHLCYLVTGLALWWPVLQDSPRRLAPGLRAAYLFAAFVLASPIGLLLALLPHPIYGFYRAAPRTLGLSALADQQVAGVTMAVEQAVVFFSVFARCFLRFLQEEETASVFGSPTRT